MTHDMSQKHSKKGKLWALPSWESFRRHFASYDSFRCYKSCRIPCAALSSMLSTENLYLQRMRKELMFCTEPVACAGGAKIAASCTRQALTQQFYVVMARYHCAGWCWALHLWGTVRARRLQAPLLHRDLKSASSRTLWLKAFPCKPCKPCIMI